MTNEEIIQVFHQNHLRATSQRMQVYRFLKENPIHPSADTVYQAIHSEYPGLSRTTIYNVLDTFVQNGLAITVKLDEKELRYDGDVSYHGHFKCEQCGRIYDFPLEPVSFQGLADFQIVHQDVYFIGYCPNCQNILKK